MTQKALHDFLCGQCARTSRSTSRGPGALTSVLGNALDRGIGYAGEKDRDVYAIEALLSDGSLVGPAAGRNHRSRPHPAGPSTDALFFQSGYGIVVGARIRLRIRQEAEDALVLQGPIEPLLATLKRAYDEGLVSGPTHVSEPGRTQRLGFGLLRGLWRRDPTPAEVSPALSRTQLLQCAPWACAAAGGWWTPPGPRSAGWRGSGDRGCAGRARQRLASAAKWLRIAGARNQSTRLLAIRPLLALVWGEPSDVGLASLDGFRDGNPDLLERGAIYGNAVSSVGEAQAKATSAIVRRHWAEAAFTWIILDGRCMITVYTLHFDGGVRG